MPLRAMSAFGQKPTLTESLGTLLKGLHEAY